MKKTDKTIRILIADDHAVIRDGLSMILGLQDDFTVIGQAQDGLEAVELCRRSAPDVGIMDLMMPKLDGCAATQKITSENPDIRILLLTSYTESSKILHAIKGGASGAIGKNAPREELLSAIRSVAGGKTVFSDEIKQLMAETKDMPVLSPRQKEVLEALSRGLTNDDIARQYNLSRAVIKFHLLELYRKLGVANRTEAVSIAMKRHLLGD